MTPQQQEFIRMVQSTDDNILLDARAGTGKTTTLLSAIEGLNIPILALAFNKSIQQELSKKLPQGATAKTFNGLGHVTWGNQIGRRCIVSTSKSYDIILSLIKEDEDSWGDAYRHLGELISSMAAAKTIGLVPDEAPANPKGLVSDLAENWESVADDNDLPEHFIPLLRQALLRSIQDGWQGNIDFNDQLYLPVIYRGPFPRGQYKLLIVDEAQDLSPIQHRMVEKTLGKARLIAAGDPYQSIYGFRGAASDSMRLFQKKFSMTPCTLSVSFRVPHNITEHIRAEGHVEDIESSETLPEGAVETWREWSPKDIPENATILCRTNAPVFNLAMQLLANGQRVQMLGRDLHKNLKKILDKNLGKDISETVAKLHNWLAEETQKARIKSNRSKERRLNDQYEALIAILVNTKTVEETQQKLERMFSSKSGIILSTIHRVKGLEYQQVFILRRDLIPIGFAETPDEIQQEYNLLYVAQTRALSRLVYLEDQG